ncbi:MAG: phosphotransacetylase family protein [Actinobacteria bacterium]|nr:phosphotransacetylase family protein [Actinomycetota bacterium]
MTTLYVISTEAHSGKTGLCLSLGLELIERGFKIGYMKPIGTLPGRVDDKTVDLDAYYVLKRLNTGDEIEYVSPVALTRRFMAAHFKGESVGIDILLKKAFSKVSEGKDVVLVEDGADVNEGRFMNAATFQIADMMEAKAILLTRFRSELVVDDILEAQDLLKSRLLGVIFNQVINNDRPTVEMIIPYLEKKGIKTYGIMPRDRTLRAVTVDEIAAHLNGTILTAVDRTGELVENFMVGAMGQEKAFRFFQAVPNKAVITGGDRADVQLAALETPTKALILTGNLQPSPIVLARAEDKGVPMILVDLDTLSAVEKTDELVGRVRVHQDQKIRKFRELLKSGVDLEALFADAGI